MNRTKIVELKNATHTIIHMFYIRYIYPFTCLGTVSSIIYPIRFGEN